MRKKRACKRKIWSHAIKGFYNVRQKHYHNNPGKNQVSPSFRIVWMMSDHRISWKTHLIIQLVMRILRAKVCITNSIFTTTLYNYAYCLYLSVICKKKMCQYISCYHIIKSIFKTSCLGWSLHVHIITDNYRERKKKRACKRKMQ